MRDIFFNSSTVLTYIIKRCYLKGVNINHANAQRLMYCSYGSVMALFNMRLTDERPITWESGPIFPRALFDHMHHQLNFSDQHNPLEQELCSPAILYVINKTVDNFAVKKPEQIDKIITSPGTPWYKLSNNGQIIGTIIDDALIHDYFLANVVNPLGYDGPNMEINIQNNNAPENYPMWA